VYTEELNEVAKPIHFGIKVKIYLFTKRLFDIIISLIGLIVLFPIFLIIMLAIKIDSKGPAIFTQERIGKNGKKFKFYKFRSMIVGADDVLFELIEKDEKIRNEYKKKKKLEEDPRITKVGKFIRNTSLDELSQLFNILKGDMSLIGNRPYLEREIVDMGEYYSKIILSKPGLTGYWQTSGRNKTSFEERLKMEAEYSEKMNFLMDIKIFFKTFLVLFHREGV
jgi:lipopolysaccharide/colanic/teichoic acid biosynthesis glycosyltransferase